MYFVPSYALFLWIGCLELVMAFSIQRPLLNFRFTSSSSELVTYDQPTSCGDSSDIFKVQSIELSPDPPVRGQPLRLILKGTLDEDVVDGSTARVKVRLGVIQLIDQEFNLCEQVKNVDKECPLKKGPFEMDKAFDIPSEIPRGRYRIHVVATNADSRQIGCFDIDFRISQ